MLTSQLMRLTQLGEAGYGDAYILYDVQHLQATGQIYRDQSRPPYVPAQYSPMVYLLYALPGSNKGNPFLRPRLIAFAAFLLCVAITVSLVRALIPLRFARLWGLLLASSISLMEEWVLQIRGDFPAIFFSLAAIRLLMIRSSYAALLAGLCAGFATQFKFVYVAALLAGSLWLLLRRKWKEFALFATAGALSSAGGYFLFWLREPRMISQILAISPGVRDVLGDIQLIGVVIQAPVILLALPALPMVLARSRPRWRLLFLFALLSLGIGAMADIQAGGNINYFFEGLFALVPFAALGCIRLLAWSRKNHGLAVFLTGLIVVHFSYLEMQYFRNEITSARVSGARNRGFRSAEAALSGMHIFSTIPRLSLLDPQPALTEPFLLSYLLRIGKGNVQPILERVRNAEFDVVLTDDGDTSWRGIPHINPPLRQAIIAGYRPYCLLSDASVQETLLYLPRSRPGDPGLKRRLARIGCAAYPPSQSFP